MIGIEKDYQTTEIKHNKGHQPNKKIHYASFYFIFFFLLLQMSKTEDLIHSKKGKECFESQSRCKFQFSICKDNFSKTVYGKDVLFICLDLPDLR